MYKKIVAILSMLFITIGVFPFLSVEGSQTADASSRIEGVLVVDVSKSMDDSDKNHVSNEAMKMFIDMSSISGDKIGVVAYTDEVIREKALVEMRTDQDKADLKSFIDSLGRYPFTDLSVGVNEAVKILDLGHEDKYFPLIVLLADGNNDFNKAKSRTQAESDQDLAKAIKDAKTKGYPIYTIGLNADGQLNKQALKHIADETNGKFFETSTAENLPKILSEIFADHLKLKVVPVKSFTANGDYQDIKIPIPNQNVLEANVSIMSNHSVALKLVDPNGKEQRVPSDQIHYSKSKSYSMVKLLKPAQGDWTLKVKGAKKDQVDVNLIFNYDLNLSLAPLKQAYQAGDTVDIAAFFEENGKQVKSKELYDNMKATLLLKDLDKNSVKKIPLTTSNGFKGSFKIGDSANYEVKVKAEDNSFYRETNVVKLTVGEGAVTKAESAFPWLKVILTVIGLIILAALVLFILAKVKQANRRFSGQMVIEIKDEDTGERSNPQYKKLNQFKGSVMLHQLLSLAPEFAETSKIVFRPGNGDDILLVNQSDCTIEKSGRAIDASKGREIKRNDRIRIVLKMVNKSIFIEYIQ